MRRLLVAVLLLAPLAAPIGCSIFPTEQTLELQPRPQWTRVSPGTETQYGPPIRTPRGTFRPEALSDAPINRPPTKTADQRGLSMSPLITARATIAEVAATRGLTPRLPTPKEQQGGWTEVYTGPGGQISVRENELGTRLEVRIKDNRTDRATLRWSLEQKLGPLTEPKAKRPS